MADKVREQKVYESLKNKYIGLGDSDTTKEEWLANVTRDRYSNMVTHKQSLYHLGVALNKPTALVRDELIQKMSDPVKQQGK